MLAAIQQFFVEGGSTMYVTATAGVIGVAITIERSWKFYREYNHDVNLFMARTKEFLLQNRVEDAIQYCQLEQKSLVAPIVKSGLERIGCDENLVRQSMESTYLEQVPKVTHRISYLAMIANAGMLFGLLGTVFGLISQFAALASNEVADKQVLMAQGIAHAMNNTALGLIVALPMLVVHGILSARSTKLTEDMERGASQLLDWIGLHNYGQLKNELRSSVFPVAQKTKTKPFQQAS